MSDKIVRIIESKAKDVLLDKWIYGTHVIAPNGKEYIIKDNPTTTSTMLKDMFLFFEINPKTVCHHLGSMDRNRKKIYTNDILLGDMANNAGYGSNTRYQEAEFVYLMFVDSFSNGIEVFTKVHKHPKNPSTYRYYPHIKHTEIKGNLYD